MVTFCSIQRGGNGNRFWRVIQTVVAKEDTRICRDIDALYQALSPSSPITDSSGSISARAASAKNMTEHKRIESRGVRADGIAHDFNSLRSCIVGDKEVALYENMSDADNGSILTDPHQVQQFMINVCPTAAPAVQEKGGTLSIDGLDLSVVYGIMKSQGGSITVKSKPGEGTTFYLLLPRQEDGSSHEYPVRNNQIPFLGRRERVLYVDDEQHAANLGATMLKILGYDPFTTVSSTEALDMFRKRSDYFDIVITDQVMPELTGTDLAKEIMKIRPEMKVILCTGHNEVLETNKVKDIGLRVFLKKPFTLEKLSTAMRLVNGANWSVDRQQPKMKVIDFNLQPSESEDRSIPFPEAAHLPSFFKQHIPQEALNSSKRVAIDEIINRVNLCHFSNAHVFISMKHPRYKENILLKALPEPCLDNNVICNWDTGVSISQEPYVVDWLIINDGPAIILAPVELKQMNEQAAYLSLLDKGYVFGQRDKRRYPGKNIEAELTQQGFTARGTLVDFTPEGLKILVRPEASSPLNWLNLNEKISITLFKSNETILTSFGGIIRQDDCFSGREIVLRPDLTTLRRFHPKKVRPERQRLVPSPKISFPHPLAGRGCQRSVLDISYSGLSIDEPADDQLLIPGLIIPELTIIFAGILKLTCKAQVIYRSIMEDKTVRCGLAFLDMNVPTYNQLTQLISNTRDENVYISNQVDLDSLWEFLFETGFIYPKKYKLVNSYVDRFKEVYRKLYQETPEIALHFTYEKNGRLHAHVSLLRAYDKAWMIHHHAARALSGRRTGFSVLVQMINYVNGIYQLPTPCMDYVFCYFRPDNGFPDLVYGDFARDYNTPRNCSLDLYAYMTFKMSSPSPLPDNWTLRESCSQDLWELELFYRNHSASVAPSGEPGLFVEGLGLRNDPDGMVKKLFSKLGFVRNWRTVSLLKEDRLKAIFLVNQADLGINLSELLNSISVIVIDPHDLSWEILSKAINKFGKSFQMGTIPVMIYPFEYAVENNIPFERKYFLWVFNLQRASADYLDYLNKRFRLHFG